MRFHFLLFGLVNIESDSFRYVCQRGQYAGRVFYPHRTKDGRYIVSPDRFAKNYRYVETAEEIIESVKQGLSVRMSAQSGPASLVSPKTLMEQNPQLFG